MASHGISVIIPTYKEPDYLDICLTSAISTQVNSSTEIIVVVDGYYDINRDVLRTHSNHIKVINLESNVGLARATNIGVYQASNPWILIVNDDNVFPVDWDKILLEKALHINRSNANRTIFHPNQIEPHKSIFRSFKIIDKWGKDSYDFDLTQFLLEEPLYREDKIGMDGSTLPILMQKKHFLTVGGWDPDYQSPHVVDWDFFTKIQLLGLQPIRLHHLNFFHFSGKATSSNNFDRKEADAHNYYHWKWGYYPMMLSLNRIGSVNSQGIRGL